MRKIILSADDFGRSHERNLAIDYAFKNGLIKSAALLVNSDFSDEAARMAHEGGYINNLHCHLNLASGEISGNAKPLDSEFTRCSDFCENGAFRPKEECAFFSKETFNNVQFVFLELEAQYKRFIALTDNQGNNSHIDFHLYYNLNVPVALALRKLMKKYNIKTARYFGEHHKMYGKRMKIKLFIIKLLERKDSNIAKACNIDFYVSDKKSFYNNKYIELYVHPDYVDGELIDNSVSVFGHERETLCEQYNKIKNDGDLISWAELN